MVIAPQIVARTAEEFSRLVEEEGVTIMSQTPSAFRQFISCNEEGGGREGSLRAVIFGGEALEYQVLKGWMERYGDERPQLINMYGITETTVHTTYKRVRREDVKEGVGSVVGKPLGNMRMYVLDDCMQAAPMGVIGELYVGGGGMARGYAGREDLTAERFLPSPYGKAGERVYRTGDLARYLKGGEIEYIGRKDHQVKIRGYRIEHGEIEEALRQYEGIREAVVTARGEEEGEKRLVAYLVSDREQRLKPVTLREYLKQKLPDYMLPVAYISLEALPITPNGKLDRGALPAPADSGRRTEEYVAFRTPIEEIVVGILEEVLRLDRVGIYDNFFEIGGHSLLAIQVASRVRSAFGVEIGVRSIFEEPAVEGLARRIEEAMRAGERDEAPPLVRVSREGRLPLSYAQQRLWFIDQLEPGNAIYNIPGAVRLEGRLDIEALERSVGEIVRRHESLRTRFEVEAGEPAQVIDAWEPRRLEVTDLTRLTPEGRETEINLIMREEAETGFDLRRGPLLRVKVLKLEEEEHVLLYTMHHIVSDEWSMEVVAREVGMLYQAFERGEESPLAELEIQYADYAVWQMAYLAGGVMQAEVGYWKEQLRDAALLELPADHPRPATPSHRGGLERVKLGRELSEGLRKLSRREGATLFMALMAGFKALLMRYSGEEDVVVGTVIANRTRREVEGLIGFFVNTLVLRTDLSGNPSIREVIGREREVALGAYGRQEAPFEKLVEEINPHRDLSRSPLFQALMTLQNTGREELSLGGPNMAGIEKETVAAKFDLTLNLTEGEEVIGGVLEYSQDLYERETIVRLARHYERLLEEMVRDPERRIMEIDLLSREERRQIIEEWNPARIEYEREACIHRLFEAQVERSPEAVAVICEGERISYRELNRRANRLGHHLQGLGVGPGVIVGVCLERSIEAVAALMGVWKAGGVYLPMDPDYPEQRLKLITEDAGAGVVVTRAGAGEKLREAGVNVLDMEQACAEIERHWEENPESVVEGDDLAYVIYTSGSTGTPKGVMVEHRNLAGLLEVSRRRFGFGAKEEMLCLASFSFDISLFELINPLAVGGKANLVSRERILELGGLLEELKRVTSVHAVPSLMKEIVEGIRRERGKGRSYGNVEKVFVGGEPVPAELLAEMREVFGEARIEVLYGPTEGTVICASHEVESDEGGGKKIIGRPLENAGIRICNWDGGLSPIGVRGELGIVGEGVARGYLNRPELTAERFIPDGYSRVEGERMYLTGDVVRYEPDGKIEFMGRRDGQVKLRGYRIEPGEIEAALNGHEAVRQSVVVAMEDDGGDKRLIGYVVVEGEVRGEEVKRYLRERVPGYMAPEAIVVLKEMPLTVNGKIDRRRLPTPDGIDKARGYEAPVGATETVLARVWIEVLKVERVGRHDNFFELGGHSLLAVRLIERMRQEGLSAGVRTLFTTSTLAALAATVGRESGIVDVPPNLIPPGSEMITPEMLPLARLSEAEIRRITEIAPGGAANVQDIYPLTALQEGILFHHLMESEGDPYLLYNLYRFDTRERMEGFLEAMQRVINRHDILRTSVVWEGLAEPAQVVWREAELTVEEVRLEPEECDVSEALLKRFNPQRYRLDVSQAPLMRVCVAQEARDGRWVMLHLFHHLLGDHTSLEVLQREVHLHLLGQAEKLPEALPFRNFVAQARMGVSLEEHEEFFGEMLGDVGEPTAPFGLMDVRGDGSKIREARAEVDLELCGRLRRTAKRLGVSAASLCHLAWALVLGRASGRDDVVFGTVLFGRMYGGEGAGSAPGMFINTLPIRIRIGEGGVAESAREAHRLLAQLIEHEHAPLALAQRCSGVAPPAPLFSALLNYRRNAGADDPIGEEGEGETGWEGIEALGGEERTNYPLGLNIDDVGEGLLLNAQAQWPVEPGRINRYMQTALERLVEALEEEPLKAVCDLDVMPCEERERLLEEWNATDAEYPKNKCIHTLFEEQVVETPDAVAVTHDERQLSYGELNARANRLADYLRSMSVRPGARVAVLLERSIELVLAEMAILKCGAAYVPVDQNAPIERQTLMIADCGARLALTVKELQSSEIAGVERVNMDELRLEDRAAHNPEIWLESEAPAYVIYTSGSTGQPKGVAPPHRAIVRLIVNNRYAEFERGDRVAFTSNPAFDASTMEVWGPLLHGGSVVVISQAILLDPDALVSRLHRERVNILHLVAGLMSAYAEPLAEVFPGLRYLLTGGDVVDARAVARVLRQSPPRRLIHCYGPSESTTFATTHEVAELSERDRSIPIGRPIANTQIYLLDSHGQPAPIGVAGGIYIGGAGVAIGYLDRADLTAESFLPDPFGEAGGRIYKTGDMGRWLPEGVIEFLGRRDYQVKIRGFRIELGEIEARLAEHAAVKEAVVLAHDAHPGDKQLVAYVVTRQIEQDNHTKSLAKSLRNDLSRHLPEYMIPAAYVYLESLPLTPNGKVDRQALAALEAKMPEESVVPGPSTPVEEMLMGVFGAVLKLNQINIRESFFEIGGHSLSAMQVISRVRSMFGVEIGVRSIFDEPTVEGLARSVEKAMRAGERDEGPPLVRVPKEGRLPLSFAQQRLWFIDQLEPGNAVYNIPGVTRLEGRLDLSVLERVINEIIRRHEVLRTRFEVEAGEPAQVIDAWEPRRLEVTDLTKLIPEEREAEISRITREEAETGFDLRRGPLLRVKALKLEEEEHVLLCTMHHIVSDGWSMGILIGEVGALYQAFQQGEASPLEELPIQYADYAVWQRKYLAGGVMHAEVGYWKERLKGAAVLELPADHPRPAAPSHRGGLERVALERELSEGLRRLSRREGATLFMVLMAGFKALLMRYSGEEDVVVGTVVANRTRREVEGLIGFFVNTLALRTDLSGNPSIVESIRREREVALGAYGRQEAPFEKLVEEINPQRDLSRSPLFQVMMALQNMRQEELSPGGLNAIRAGEETRSAKFDLTLDLMEGEEGIGGVVEYSQDLYERETIERLARHYERVLKEMVRDPEQRIREIELMSGSEREQVLVAWNETARAYPRDRTTHEMFEEQARRRPDAVAVVYEEQEVSYGELNRRANRLAHYLRRLGVGPEALVGICIDNCVETVVGFLGILKAGGAYLPLDPSCPAERLRLMLKDGEPLVIVTQERFLGVLPEFSGEIICLDRDRLLAEGESEENPPLQVRGENLAYVIYTSGSTGRPKGICITHRAINRLVINTDYVSLDSSSRVGQAANSSFDAVTFEIWGALLAGGTVIVIKKEEALSVAELGRQLQLLKINTLFVTTALFNEMARLVPESLSNLETLMFGGEAVEPRWVGEVLEKGSPERLLHVYGPTESTTFATWHEVDQVEKAARSVPIGRPIANTEVYLLDGGVEPAPPGVTGEIYLGGDGLARGYLGRPDHTAERFVPHPFREGGGRLYRTGDLGRRDADGSIGFLGRVDWQVKLRGYRIELKEIEAVLSEHRSVKQCIVVAGDDQGRGKRLLAYVVGEAEVTAMLLKRHLRERLPEYMAPEAILVLEEMPLTANGKIDRRRLPAPADARQSMEGSLVYPRDLLEFKLLQVWESVLGVHPIGVKDNFFDLGGHSLLALRLMAGIRSAVGRELPLSALFQGGTIESMAAILRRDASSISWSCLVELQASGSRSPLFLVHPAGGNVLCFSDLARRLGSDRPVYGLQTPGLHGERPLYARIEDMAAHYIEAIRTVQPEGPYLLGGWSLGGIIAYEMAQQLIAQDQRIGHLLMLDSAINNARRENVERDEETPDDEDAQDAEILMGTINGHLPISMEEMRQLHGDERIDFILKKAISMNFLPPDTEIAQARHGLTVFKTNLRAMEQYVPQVYSGAVSLFRTNGWLASPSSDEPSNNGRMLDTTRDSTMGWGVLAARGVQIIEIPGEHATMLSYPYVETLALRITAHIDDTRTTPE